MGFELRVPVFEHDPDNGVYSSDWTNDVFEAGDDTTCATAEEAINLANEFAADCSKWGESGFYINVVNVYTEEVVYEGRY